MEDALKALMAEVRAEALAERDAVDKADSAAQMDKIVVRNFSKAGYGQVTPRVDTKRSPNGWRKAFE